MSKLTSTADLENLRQTLLKKRDPDQPCITICAGTGCQAYGCDKVTDAFKQEIKKKKLGRKVAIRTTGCHGFCERGPLVVIYPKKIFYQRVAVEDVSEVISETIIKGNLVERLLYVDPDTKEKIVYEDDVPFYKKQKRLIFGHNGVIDPTSIDDYFAAGGYAALAKVLNGISPEEVIETIKKANLRGRGGGGFPAGVKWESCREAEGDVRYVICNADEGDPGAYMDRSLLEGNPHSVLEGMIIGAYAIGSNQGYVYVRNEYPLAISNLTVALKQAERYGLLGDNILGSGFSFGVKIARGGGAFVCGESSALTASLEGNVGEPRAKHIHTVESGLWDKPTNLNNVETWANVPLIIDKGADWYSKIGTEGSKGTKIFSLVGKVNNTGLVEVPMGITLREIIYDIGGGIPGGRKFKAVQTGGPSGGCIPDEHLDLPVDFDRLSEVGSMMGSGGMIVMDERTCMVDIAKYFLNFLKDESCGKCTSCREGVERMHEIVTNITLGKGKESDIELLEESGEVIAETSLCALGGTAPYPVLSTIRYFRDEYEAHIKDKKCPAGVCKELTRFVIYKEQCVGCGRCKVVCPSQAITGKKKKLHKITQKKCVKCGACFENCKFDAVRIA
ncbi:MAG: NADH-quinone oxidoreductase subunit NuoF [Deltaproteobacteria bacterium]|nr:NADH-quinone oxidoreductase subunit NuoF [Deltaproteobacteria bacterium]